MYSLPIGLLDSGVGGLSLLKEIKKQLPRENILYLSDTAHAPYGEKTEEQIHKFNRENLSFLAKRCKLILIACHSASIPPYPRKSPPIFDMIQPTLSCLQAYPKKRIALLATRKTINAKTYSGPLSSYTMLPIACPMFAPCIEQGDFEGVSLWIKHYLASLALFKPDAIILGCTHYPLILPLLKKAFPYPTDWLDPAQKSIQQIKEHLQNSSLLNPQISSAYYQFYATMENGKNLKALKKIRIHETILNI